MYKYEFRSSATGLWIEVNAHSWEIGPGGVLVFLDAEGGPLEAVPAGGWLYVRGCSGD